jgi:hypothetical protein
LEKKEYLKEENKILMLSVLNLLILVLLVPCYPLMAQSEKNDTLNADKYKNEKQEMFFDSLGHKAKKNSFTGILYDFIITQPRKPIGGDTVAYNYYARKEGKIISEISINILKAFGPSLDDTTRHGVSLVEKTANAIHTTTGKRTIAKMLLFKVGDFLDPELMYENERIIRSLRYIQDVRFILEQDSVYKGLVKVHVLTKDRFPIGVTGDVNGIKSAALELYNQNIFGVGHEISFRFVGHLRRQPYAGLETFYKINNISGKFLDITAGYMNTYKREGFSLLVDKPFFTPSVVWGYGGSALRMHRTERINDHDPILTDIPMNLSILSAWGGRSFPVKPNYFQNSQMVISAGFYNYRFFERPAPEPGNNQYFANSTMYLAGITLAQRHYIQDHLVYSYGITEDIPEGFKNELVYGFDVNEFGNRHYAHLFLSNGNLLIKRQGYLYLSGGIGGYLRNNNYEQGQVQVGVNYISRQISAGRKRLRLFVRSNYLLGIRRFEIENLDLNRNDHIRGFRSENALGKQRLSLNIEYVMFLPQQFYKFRMAAFAFADLGIIGTNSSPIYTQNYYSGLGFGMRFHNEHLVFKTFQIRFAFYPFSPSDVNFAGILVEEQLKQDFYNFRPAAPMPLQFQ